MSSTQVPPLAKTPRPAAPAGTGRVQVVDVSPVREGGRWPAKAVVGEGFRIEASVFMEGHGAVGASAVLKSAEGKVLRRSMTLASPGLARWVGVVAPTSQGQWTFQVEGWSDPYATWHHDAVIKVNAGIDVDLMLEMGARLLEEAAKVGRQRQRLTRLAATMRNGELSPDERLAAGAEGWAFDYLRANPIRQFVTKSAAYHLVVQRERALVGSWYEVFPRSVGATFTPTTGWVGGNFKTLGASLGRVAEMGFDVLYLTPIHPIGQTFRKGRNNSLNAKAADPGSPYAIGSELGGHDAIHPDLGTLADFDSLVAKANSLGLEVALDLALQCSPDHPWVDQHPEWFAHRPDGTIAYAENPPKKYQDIYPLSFDSDPEGLYQEILRVLRFWVSHGVKIFRVDNPHTKPLVFWERLLAQFAAEAPDVIFLSEAFTKPPMMHTLALIGFHQSYTYFAWRNTKEEVTEYLAELSSDWGAFMRPAIWPITPDILTPYMQHGGAAAYRIRAILAATMAPTWGIYSGYELIENTARPGSEESIDNEKYEYKVRDFGLPIAVEMSELLKTLNNAKHNHVALRQLRNVTIHSTSDDATVCFSKHVPAELAPDGVADTIIVVLNLDPDNTREGVAFLDLAALALAEGQISFQGHDLMNGETYTWGAEAFFRLDPNHQPGHVIHIRS